MAKKILEKKDLNIDKKELNIDKKNSNMKKKELNLGKKDLNVNKKDLNVIKKDLNLGKKDLNVTKKDSNVIKKDLNVPKKTVKSNKSVSYIKDQLVTKSVFHYCVLVKRLQSLFENLRTLCYVCSKENSERKVKLVYSPFTFKVLDILKENKYISNFEREKKNIYVELAEVKLIKNLEVLEILSPQYINYEELKEKDKKGDLTVLLSEEKEFTSSRDLLKRKEGGLFIFRIN